MNIIEFARKIGVSPTAVSFAINNRPGHISTETRQMILRRMKELGFRPNTVARALVTQRTHVIALWTQDIFPPYYTHTIAHLRQLVMAEDFGLDIINLPQSFQKKNSHSWPVEGIIAFARGNQVKEMVVKGSLDTPIVDIMGVSLESVDYVTVNAYDASVQAVEHLINSGRRRIAYLMPSQVDLNINNRSLAYSEVMRQAGFETEFIHFDAPNDSMVRTVARDMVKEYVKNCGCPDAIFGSDDEAAIGAYKGLRNLGKHIPDDVALVGCDGISDTEFIDPSLSTIIHPVEEVCKTAWEFLKNRMTNPETPHQCKTFKAQLALRGSSEPSSKSL